MLKDGSGWGAMTGVSAAYLAGDGFTGAPALTVEDDAVREIWDDLGERWRILEKYFKPYPVCRWAQPAIEAALDVRRAHALAPEDIGAIEVFTFHEATRLDQHEPATTEEAQYSLPFPVAAALVRGGLVPEDIAGERSHRRPRAGCQSEDPARRRSGAERTISRRALCADPCRASGRKDRRKRHAPCSR